MTEGTDTGALRLTYAGPVATLRLERPAKLNALTPEMLTAMGRCIEEVAASPARVLQIRAAGGRAFCVGADVTRFAGLSPVQMWAEWTARGQRTFRALAELPQVSIAVVHADAFGGGFELALAADFRIVAADALLGLPEVGLGTVPGWGGTARLVEALGRARAKEICLAGRRLDGATAYAWGLASSAPAAAQLETEVAELTTRLLAGAPVALRAAKQLLDAAADRTPAGTLESLAGALTATTADLPEGLAALRERRPARFTGG